jgi:CHASE3 domain sensor protein
VSAGKKSDAIVLMQAISDAMKKISDAANNAISNIVEAHAVNDRRRETARVSLVIACSVLVVLRRQRFLQSGGLCSKPIQVMPLGPSCCR